MSSTAEFAEKLMTAYVSGLKIDSATPELPGTLQDAYACQAAFAETLATRSAPIGWKIGATNAGARTKLGADAPFWGRMFAERHRADGESLPYDELQHAVVEVEFALELSRDLPFRPEGYSVDEVKDATSRVILSYEVVSTRFDNFPGRGILGVVSDNACSGGWVEGPSSADWKDLDFADIKVTLEKNGEVVAEGSSAMIETGPFGQLAWFASTNSQGLKAGEIISTGTAVPPPAGVKGDSFVATFEGLGSVSMSLS